MVWIVESAVTAVMLMAVTLQPDTAAVSQAGQVSCVSLSLPRINIQATSWYAMYEYPTSTLVFIKVCDVQLVNYIRSVGIRNLFCLFSLAVFFLPFFSVLLLL